MSSAAPSSATLAATGNTVLVTGAFGNLGQMVLKALQQRGFRAIAMDLDSARNHKIANRMRPLYDQAVWGDIRSTDFTPFMDKVNAIIHLAALLPPLTDTAPALAESINVGATLKLIDTISAAAHKPLLVFPSSVTVFGYPLLTVASSPVQKTIADPVLASDNYTHHKIAIEQRLRNSHLPYCILRVGVSVDARTLAADRTTLKKLLQVAPDNPLEYIHPVDVATAIVNCIGNNEAIGKTLLLGGGDGCRITQHEFLCAALNAAGISLPRELMGTQAYYTHWMDTAESNRILQFQQHTFDDYKQEMQQRLRLIRPLVKPLAPLLATLLKQWLQK